MTRVRSFLRDLFQSRRAAVGAVLLAAILSGALFAPLLAVQDPYALQSLRLENSHLPPGSVGAGGELLLLGTDILGRDVWSAILYGLRTSIGVGVLSGMIALAVGTCVGLAAAYWGGRVDALVMRVVDLQLSLPSILVALILLSVFGRGLDKIVLALVIVQWAFYARNVRATALSEAGREYIAAARGLRVGRLRILFVHLLPNCLPPLTVIGTLQVANAIALESTLSFLGIGLPVTAPSLGLLVANGFQYMLAGMYWVSVFPGLALLLLIVGINLVGDRIRTLLNPRLRVLEAPAPLASAPADPGPTEAVVPVLAVRGLRTWFSTPGGVAKSVDGIDLSVRPGEVLGIVGESGSGKSVTGRSILGLIDPPGRVVAGSVRLDGRELVGLDEEDLRQVRGRQIAMICQDPMMTLNPVLRIDTQMLEALAAHGETDVPRARNRAVEALRRVGIPAPEARLLSYPHELSGGMRQRVAIAIAMLNDPRVIIADEPTTALDVTVQSQILAEMQRLTRETGTALVWITHDLGVVAGLADRIAVMYAGRIVEEGPAEAILATPRHPYTRALLESLPARSPRGAVLPQIPGQAPPPTRRPPGCAFVDRCAQASALCATYPLARAEDTGRVFCHHPLGDAA